MILYLFQIFLKTGYIYRQENRKDRKSRQEVDRKSTTTGKVLQQSGN